MRTPVVLLSAVAVLLPLSACDSDKTYSVSFVCESDGGAGCPSGDECPVVPEGTDACGDVPGVLGHEPMPIDMARPVGCRVGLAYGNPAFGDSQVVCTCSSNASPATWWCPI
jgi:hypothetical protein